MRHFLQKLKKISGYQREIQITFPNIASTPREREKNKIKSIQGERNRPTDAVAVYQ